MVFGTTAAISGAELKEEYLLGISSVTAQHECSIHDMCQPVRRTSRRQYLTNTASKVRYDDAHNLV